MRSIKSLIKDTVPYKEDGNAIHFILDENARPHWSKALSHYLTTSRIDLKISDGNLYPLDENDCSADRAVC